MRSKIFIMMALVLLMAASRASSGDCDTKISSTAPNAVYAAVIDDCIAKCQCKALLMRSRSAHIRREARQAILKWAFLTANRETLVQYLASQNVMLHPVRIQYYLNQQCCKALRSKEFAALINVDRPLSD